MDQANKMRFLRIKIDVCTKGFPEQTRDDIRSNLRELFCREIPARRLWFYLKSTRSMSLRTPDTLGDSLGADFEGPEDVIVKG